MSIEDSRPRDGFAYAVVPEWVLDSDVSAVAVRLFAVLDRYVGRNESAWPSRRTLAARLRCSSPTVDRALRELADVGALEVRHRYRESDGSQLSSAYVLWPGTLEAADPPRHRRRPPSSSVMPPLIAGDEAERSNPREVTPVKKDLSVETSFEETWLAYPRKRAKKAALRAYVATIKSRRSTVADLRQATVNYAVARAGQDEQFTLHGSTFYGPDERWRDYLTTTGAVATEERLAAARAEEDALERERARTRAASVPMPDNMKKFTSPRRRAQ